MYTKVSPPLLGDTSRVGNEESHDLVAVEKYSLVDEGLLQSGSIGSVETSSNKPSFKYVLNMTPLKRYLADKVEGRDSGNIFLKSL